MAFKSLLLATAVSLFLASSPMLAFAEGPSGSADPTKNCANIQPQRKINIEKMLGESRDCAELQKMLEMITSVTDVMPVFWEIYSRYYRQMSPGEFQSALLAGLVDGLDPHSHYFGATERAKYMQKITGDIPSTIGIEFGKKVTGGILVMNTIEDAPAHKAGIQRGDLLFRIDGVLVSSMKDANEVYAKMSGASGSTVKLDLIREGVDEYMALTLVRTDIQSTVIKGRLFGGQYGYLRISAFSGRDFEEFARRVDTELDTIFSLSQGALKGLVVDLRDNPGGILVAGNYLSSKLINKEGAPIIAVKNRKGTFPYMGPNNNDPKAGLAGKGDPRLSNVPLLVLVNGASASAAEFVAANVQCYGMGVVASPRDSEGNGNTRGKGSVQITRDIPVPEGSAITYSIYEYLACGKVVVQGVGVTPDILLKDIDEDNLFIRESDVAGHMLGSKSVPDARPMKSIKETDPGLYAAARTMLKALKMEVAE